MSAELGGASACTVHKDGRVTGGMKYHEGRMTGFAEARRVTRRADDPTAAVRELHRRWLDELDRRRGEDRPSPPWVAYATGGAEAAAQVRRAWDGMARE